MCSCTPTPAAATSPPAVAAASTPNEKARAGWRGSAGRGAAPPPGRARSSTRRAGRCSTPRTGRPAGQRGERRGQRHRDQRDAAQRARRPARAAGCPTRATRAPPIGCDAISPSIEQSSARPSSPSPIPVRSWIAGRREKSDPKIAPLSAKMTVTAARGVTTSPPEPPLPAGRATRASTRFVATQTRQPHVLVAALVSRPDHLHVAVERRELLRRLVRVGGDPVRRAPLGGVAQLVRQLEQPLDQRAGRRVELLGARGQVASRALRPLSPPPPWRRMPAIRAWAYCT